ncbi:MAG: putative CRISPR-associated protein [Candidatus Eremiobacterota bacterium]
MAVTTLLSTVGTSLLQKGESGANLAALDPHDRDCGAEINSIAELMDRGEIAPDCRLAFFHSATGDGERVASILQSYYGGSRVSLHRVEGLQDEDPRRFRSEGLRNLVREMCRVMRQYGPSSCGINATGGYKAQIAVAVLLGQALQVEVYYKHEKFSEIIAFPPLPVSLDQNLWLDWSWLFFALNTASAVEQEHLGVERLDARLEALVEVEEVEGEKLLALSPAGQVFHEAFVQRFPDRALPPEASKKRAPRVDRDHAWRGADRSLDAFLERVVDVPYVVTCRSHSFNPRLPLKTTFRLTRGQVEGIHGEDNWSARFWVDTTAVSGEQRLAAVADLNRRLSEGLL